LEGSALEVVSQEDGLRRTELLVVNLLFLKDSVLTRSRRGVPFVVVVLLVDDDVEVRCTDILLSLLEDS
jgi:hypothetical protein